MEAPGSTVPEGQAMAATTTPSPSAEAASPGNFKGDYQHLRPQTTDRGWNDPPDQLFSNMPNGSVGGKRALNAKWRQMRAVQNAGIDQPHSGASSPYGSAFGSPTSAHTPQGQASTMAMANNLIPATDPAHQPLQPMGQQGTGRMAAYATPEPTPVQHTQMGVVPVQGQEPHSAVPQPLQQSTVTQPMQHGIATPPLQHGMIAPPLQHGMATPPMPHGMAAPPMQHGMAAPPMQHGAALQPPPQTHWIQPQ